MIPSATVTARIRRPDGSESTVSLLGDGNSRDGKLDDGLYGVLLTETLPGAYDVVIEANGVGMSGEQPFYRQTRYSFVIPGAPLSDGLEPPVN